MYYIPGGYPTYLSPWEETKELFHIHGYRYDGSNFIRNGRIFDPNGRPQPYTPPEPRKCAEGLNPLHDPHEDRHATVADLWLKHIASKQQ